MERLHHSVFANRGYRVSEETLREQLPELMTEDDPLWLSAKDKATIKELYDEMADPDDPGGVKNLRQRQAIELVKVPYIVERAKEIIESGGSVVLFLNFHESIDTAKKQFPEAEVIDGRVPQTERRKTQDSFQKNDLRGVIVQIAAGGQSIDLHDLDGRYPRVALLCPQFSGTVEEQAVVEIDREGQVLWRYGPVAATLAKPLANGNLLVVDYPGGRVLELGRDRSIRWQYSVDEPCFDAERLNNGHTLVATANLIKEIAFDGGTVWQWQIRGRVNGVQALSDGRILVANYGANEVAELNDEARVVRRIDEPQPSDALRLANGHTLVATATRVVEFNPSGELLRVLTTARYGSARR
jgi:hypothetical protein